MKLILQNPFRFGEIEEFVLGEREPEHKTLAQTAESRLPDFGSPLKKQRPQNRKTPKGKGVLT